jgi:hypothetical protein
MTSQHKTDEPRSAAQRCVEISTDEIWKAYGSIARKGDQLANYPHRLTGLLDVPDPLPVVSKESLEHIVVALLPKAKPCLYGSDKGIFF